MLLKLAVLTIYYWNIDAGGCALYARFNLATAEPDRVVRKVFGPSGFNENGLRLQEDD